MDICGLQAPYRVSDRNKTQIYGKSTTVREGEVQPTLPRTDLFGKVVAKKCSLFQDLRTTLPIIEPHFSEKGLGTTIPARSVGPSRKGEIP